MLRSSEVVLKTAAMTSSLKVPLCLLFFSIWIFSSCEKGGIAHRQVIFSDGGSNSTGYGAQNISIGDHLRHVLKTENESDLIILSQQGKKIFFSLDYFYPTFFTSYFYLPESEIKERVEHELALLLEKWDSIFIATLPDFSKEIHRDDQVFNEKLGNLKSFTVHLCKGILGWKSVWPSTMLRLLNLFNPMSMPI